MIDRELYLPAKWCADRARCERAGIPDAVAFATKPEPARWMVERAIGAGVPFAWFAADEVYGQSWPTSSATPPPGTTLAELVAVAGARWAVEDCFAEAKSEAGLDHYQVRMWQAWNRQITLSMLAYAFLAVTARACRPGRQPPGLAGSVPGWGLHHHRRLRHPLATVPAPANRRDHLLLPPSSPISGRCHPTRPHTSTPATTTSPSATRGADCSGDG